jgi:hypothetical protein
LSPVRVQHHVRLRVSRGAVSLAERHSCRRHPRRDTLAGRTHAPKDAAVRKPHLFLLLVCALSLLILAPSARSAPTLGDKPVKYEYAELTFGRVLPRQAFGGGLGGGAGGPGGGGGPAAGPVVAPIKWTTGEDEIEVQEWSDLADKLKAPAPKKESPQGVHKLRVLNKLSAEGWEMMDQSLSDVRSPAMMGWSFRRRLP